MNKPILRKLKDGNEYTVDEILDAVNKHGYAKTMFHTKDGVTNRATIEISVKVKEDE